jgi:hypothetical protein
MGVALTQRQSPYLACLLGDLKVHWFSLNDHQSYCCSNGRSQLRTILLMRYGVVGCIHKYPMMVWTHQLSCCENSIILSVFNSCLFPSNSSMPRPLKYWQFYLPSNQYYMVVLKTCNEILFFISVITSEIRRFKFTAIWLCGDYIAAGSFRRERLSTTRYDSPLRAVEWLQFSKIDVIFIASRELVGNSRMGAATGPRSR